MDCEEGDEMRIRTIKPEFWKHDGTVDDLDDTSLEFCRDVAQAFAALGASVRFVRVPVARAAGMPYI